MERNKSVTLSDVTNAQETGQYFHLVTGENEISREKRYL